MADVKDLIGEPILLAEEVVSEGDEDDGLEAWTFEGGGN